MPTRGGKARSDAVATAATRHRTRRCPLAHQWPHRGPTGRRGGASSACWLAGSRVCAPPLHLPPGTWTAALLPPQLPDAQVPAVCRWHVSSGVAHPGSLLHPPSSRTGPWHSSPLAGPLRSCSTSAISPTVRSTSRHAVDHLRDSSQLSALHRSTGRQPSATRAALNERTVSRDGPDRGESRPPCKLKAGRHSGRSPPLLRLAARRQSWCKG